MRSLKENKWNILGAVLVVAGVCSIYAAANAGMLIFSSPETQKIIESPNVSYDQKKAVLYSEALQQDNPDVENFAALRTTAVDPDAGTLAYVCNLWDDLNENWKVVSDPKGPEYISSSPDSIRADLRGDCDDYSVLMSGLAESIGAETRIVNVAGTGNYPGHAFPEYYLGNNTDRVKDACRYIAGRYGCSRVYYSFNGMEGETTYWLNLDWGEGRYPDIDYYLYGNSNNYHELVHPGQSYTSVGKSAVFFYPDGTYSSDKPGHGYYERDMLGRETLNVIQT